MNDSTGYLKGDNDTTEGKLVSVNSSNLGTDTQYENATILSKIIIRFNYFL